MIYRKKPYILSIEDEGETAILNPVTETYFSLVGVATVIWRQLGKGSTLDEIVEHVRNKYKVDETECRNDAIEFLNKLIKKGLIDEDII